MAIATRKHLCIPLMGTLLVLALGGCPPPKTTLDAPTGVLAAGGNGEVTVTWEPVTDALSYNLYWSTTSGVTSDTGSKIAGVSSPYLHTGLTNGTTYYYVVTAEDDNGESAASAEVSALPVLSAVPVLSAPTGVLAAGGNGEVTVTWEPVTDALSYNLYWSTTSGVTSDTGTQIAGVSSPYLHTGLTNGTTYYYVVTAEDDAGESAASAEVNALPEANSTTAAGLVITEVGSMYYADSGFWFEVYNAGTTSVSLSNFSLRTRWGKWTTSFIDNGIYAKTLPAAVIPVGSYLLVRAKTNGDFVNTAQVVFVEDGAGNYPWWSTDGFVELLANGQTVDFVRFGSETTAPTTASAWGTGAAPALPAASVADYGKSIARDGANTDSNANTDWVSRDFATPGGPNDVTCNTDADADGIPDCSEVAGSTFAGMPLYEWGARTGQKDVFFHVNYMNSSDPGVIPRREALEKVATLFAGRGYTLHFDVGDLFHQAAGISPDDHDLGGGGMVPFAQGITLGDDGDGRANVYTYKNTYMPLARKQVFFYVIFAYSQEVDGSAGSSGLGEVNGNDFLISFGNWGLLTSPQTELNRLINWQASTLMHEFGHNLGLRHGGDQNLNYKPNYISIMNYLYALGGLPTIGNKEGDRYYLEQATTCNGYTAWEQITNPPTGSSASFIMDFSSGTGLSISETNIDESAGLGRIGSGAVDFNCNGVTDGVYARDLNPQDTDNSTTSDIHTDYDDWNHVSILFQRTYSGDSSGPMDPRALRVVHDPVWHDRQPVAKEQPPPPEFFERLRREIAGNR